MSAGNYVAIGFLAVVVFASAGYLWERGEVVVAVIGRGREVWVGECGLRGVLGMMSVVVYGRESVADFSVDEDREGCGEGKGERRRG